MAYPWDFTQSEPHRRSSFTQPLYQKPDLAALLNTRGPEPPAVDFDERTSKKRTRTLTTPYQLERLTQLYHETPFPSTARREELAQELDMSARRVQVWFQNKRQGQKRELAKKDIILPPTHSSSGSSSGGSVKSKTPSPREPPLLSMPLTSRYDSGPSYYRSPNGVSSDTSAAFPPSRYSTYSSYRDPTPNEPLSPATPLFTCNPHSPSNNYLMSSSSRLAPPRSRRNSLTDYTSSASFGSTSSYASGPRSNSPSYSSARSTASPSTGFEGYAVAPRFTPGGSYSSERYTPPASSNSLNLPPVSSLIPEVDRLMKSPMSYKASHYSSYY